MQAAISPINAFMAEEDLVRQLVREAKGGSAVAFERLLILHQRRVLALAQRLLLNREAARDASQEAFLRVHQKLGSIDEKRDFNAWLYRIVVNVCFDVLRRSRQMLPIDVASDEPDRAPDPERSAAAMQQRRLIQTALQSLSPRERAAIVLTDFEGLSAPEAAGILGVSAGTVRSQVSTGRCKIRHFIVARLGERP